MKSGVVKYFFGLFCLITALASPAARAASTATDAQILHLLNRISYGPSPADIQNVKRVGLEDYINQQLHPENYVYPDELQQRLAQLRTLDAQATDLVESYPLPGMVKGQDLSEDEKKEMQKHANEVVAELSQAKILRAILNPAQLQEVMTDFWFNHFNVFAEKGLDKLLVSSYERDAIRPYALGKFGDLLMATAQHPAMIFYLDNWLNTDPNSPAARGKKIGINENYGREVMELHTLGVNGGYTQTDVTTLAHILTGWGLGEGKDPTARMQFYFDPKRHDFANKTFLGYPIQGSGQDEVVEVLGLLAHHPSTAKHIAYELAQYFVADNPPQSLVIRLTDTFSSTDGDIAQTLNTLFHSPEFWDPKYYNTKFKPPFRYVISTLRANAAIPPGDTKVIQGALAGMGEPLYRCLTPNGYSNTNDQWLNSDALLKRIDMTEKLSTVLTSNSTNLIKGSLGNTWSENTLNTVNAETDPKKQLVLLMSSPEFVYY